MHKRFVKIAAVLGVLAVALGAFAAHALKAKVPDHDISIFETGVRYQFYHVFALLAVGIIYKEIPNRYLRWAGIFFISGIILFSGSLYVLLYIKSAPAPGYKWVGAITPAGGLLLISGWVFLFLGCLNKTR